MVRQESMPWRCRIFGHRWMQDIPKTHAVCKRCPAGGIVLKE